MQLNDATILIVDDEAGLLRIFKLWFQQEGCNVFTAENGFDALEVVKAQPIDVIVSDVRMPKMDGVGLARRVRQLWARASKIIFVSGFADIDERECCDLGVESILPKPILRASLVSAVRTCLTPREALWREPSAVAPERMLDAAFESLQGAQAQGKIAFGYGGFCIDSAFSVYAGESIGLNVKFKAERTAIMGQGIVRWAVRDEQQIGIEITHIDDSNRAWLADLAQAGPVSFIPRSSRIAASARGSSEH
jgi:CheY-like chemotaxis protein